MISKSEVQPGLQAVPKDLTSEGVCFFLGCETDENVEFSCVIWMNHLCGNRVMCQESIQE